MQNYTQVDSLMSMENEIKVSLCNHLAVAGVENVISTDLINRINLGFEPFIEFVEENDGFHAFWNQFSLLPLILLPTKIDEFNDLMQKILEGLEN